MSSGRAFRGLALASCLLFCSAPDLPCAGRLAASAAQASPGPASGSETTSYLSDDFEGGTGNWILGGDWGLTTGTSRSATHCLTDSPSGNYPPNVEVSATLAFSLDLVGAVDPVLRFWHKGRIGYLDYGRAQVSRNGGSTWSSLRAFGYSWYEDGWMLEQVDLPVDTNVVIRFVLDSASEPTVEDGWCIDDVWIGEKDQTRLPLPFSDDFEAGPGNWTVSGYNWDITGSTWRSGAHSLTDSPSGDYAQTMTVSAILAHPVNLGGTVDPVLRFWHKGQITHLDHGLVEVSTNGGTTWNGVRGFADAWFEDGWMLEQVDLPSSDNVVIRFVLETASEETVTDGWYLDDVWIGEKDQTRLPLPFSDGLEAGLGNWTVSGYNWDITGSTWRSGTHSLTDSPSGNYAQTMTVSAILAHPVNLGGAVDPVLRFWHQGQIGAYDYGRVQVSTNGGSTWSALRSFGSSWYEDSWMLEQIDLPSYDNVVIRFVLETASGQPVKDGWYVDDVWIGEKDQTRLPFPFSDSFEAGSGNWTVSGYNWDITGSAWRSGTHSLTDSPSGAYEDSITVSGVLAHPVDLGGAVDPVLQFWHQGRIGAYDHGRVQVSTNGGSTWSALRSFGSSWYENSWILEQIDLPSSDNVIIRFVLDSATDTMVDDGWYIDDVVIAERGEVSGIQDPPMAVAPPRLELRQNHPNPFARSTTIAFQVPPGVFAELSVYDSRGRLVKTLWSGTAAGQPGSALWNGEDARGVKVPPGVYYCRLKAGSHLLTRKAVILE